MPPKAKFTREEIIAAGLEIAREKGMKAVTAREVGKYLGTSSSPVFVAFQNMDELNEAIRAAAIKEYNEYIADAVNYTPMFKAFGFRLVEFARTQPNLFQIITDDNDSEESYEEMILAMPAADICIESIKQQTGFETEDAKKLFKQVLLAGMGICFLQVNKSCSFSEDELSEYLGLAYVGSLMAIKNADKSMYTVQPKINKK